jgi:uncharacterized protein (DUF1800 family)
MDRRAFLARTGVLPDDGLRAGTELNRLQALLTNPGSQRRALTSDLTPWNPNAGEWNAHTIGHLYRRAGFGASIDEIAAAKAKTPATVIDELLSDQLLTGNNLPAPPAHSDEWLNKPPYVGVDLAEQIKQQQKYGLAIAAMRRWWVKLMAEPQTMLRERMVIFWMNHFVIEAEKVYFPQMIYRYIDHFRRKPWGNFKQLVKDVTIQPAMLYYLDGYLSYGLRPNENYARELMELFTMGVTDKDGNFNYTEADIQEVAKALTGYTIDFTAPAPDPLVAKYDVNRHDSRLKQPFGAPKRDYGLDSSGVVQNDVIDLLFNVRANQISYFICSKLYQTFVYHDIGDGEKIIIEALAKTLRDNNWELKPVLAELLKSAHFFDEENVGADIKSPNDYLIGMMRSLGVAVDELNTQAFYYLGVAGSQVLFDPPNVKGWLGYRSWLTTTTLPQRNASIATPFLTLKQIYIPGETGYGESFTPLKLTDADLTVWSKKFAGYVDNFDAYLAAVTEFLCARIPSAKAIQERVRSKFPASFYEWVTATDAQKTVHTRRLLNELMLLAEYQLS